LDPVNNPLFDQAATTGSKSFWIGSTTHNNTISLKVNLLDTHDIYATSKNHSILTMSQLDVPRGASPEATSKASTLADEDLRSENPKNEASVIDDKTVTDAASRNSADKDPEKLDVEAAPPANELSEDEYPKGYALLSVVIALILSIFLIALDMVRAPLSLWLMCCRMGISTNTRLCRPSLLLLSRRSLAISKALTRSVGTVPSSSQLSVLSSQAVSRSLVPKNGASPFLDKFLC
jgi:hypothetical protein